MARSTPLIALPALLALVLVACGSGQAAAPPAPRSTVGDVGALPGDLPVAATEPVTSVPATTAAPTTADPTTAEPTTDSADAPTTTSSRRTTTTRPTASSASGPLGRLVDGNRVIMIGDSILAGTSERYTNEMCARLVPMGWAVEIDAETGRMVDFGQDVIDSRGDDDWDVAVVGLGTNYGGDAVAYEAALRDIIEEFDPVPVVLLTVSPYQDRQNEVNYVIGVLAGEYEHVRVVDWGGRTVADEDLLRGDGIHPSDVGRQTLVSMIAQTLGRAPSDGPDEPDCLPTRFDDDSG